MAADLDQTYDVVVLGAGPIGQNAAERARAAGLTVAMVERELVGGNVRTGPVCPVKRCCVRSSPCPILAGSTARERQSGAWHAVPCFPTISELWLRLFEAYRDSSADNG